MSDFGAISRPYAEAIFSLAKDVGDYDRWSDALNFISSLLDNVELSQVLNDPTFEKQEKIELVKELTLKANGKEDICRLVELLITNDRLPASSAIHARYEQLCREAENQLDVEIEAAAEITDEKMNLLSKALAKRFGRKVNIANVLLNEELIGGTVIRAGDTVIDDSVRGKLKTLSSALRS